jgi:hypothetical protein
VLRNAARRKLADYCRNMPRCVSNGSPSFLLWRLCRVFDFPRSTHLVLYVHTCGHDIGVFCEDSCIRIYPLDNICKAHNSGSFPSSSALCSPPCETAFPLVPKLYLGTRLSAQFHCFFAIGSAIELPPQVHSQMEFGNAGKRNDVFYAFASSCRPQDLNPSTHTQSRSAQRRQPSRRAG